MLLKLYKNILLTGLIVLLPILGWAQSAGQLDRSFHYGRGTDYQFNYGYGAILNGYGKVEKPVLQPDGKILIFGGFESYNGIAMDGLARLNADGGLDLGFNTGLGVDGSVSSMALQNDGKILIGGYFTSYNGIVRTNIARLNADGSLDASFNTPGTGVNRGVNAIALQPDGKILIGGDFTAFNGTLRNYIARLNVDGSLDSNFIPQTGIYDFVNTIVIQPNGKILIGGYGGGRSTHLARLNSDGSLDTGFNIGRAPEGDAFPEINAITLQPDGKIIVAGRFSSFNRRNRSGIVRLHENGNEDEVFLHYPGGLADYTIQSLAIQPNGKIVISYEGSFYFITDPTRSRYIANTTRLNSDGSYDPGFNQGSGPINNNILSPGYVTLQPDGKILIGGYFSGYNGTTKRGIVRLNADGNLDINFNPAAGADKSVYSIALQADGKILIRGAFTAYNGVNRNGIARLNDNGSLDIGFNPGTGITDEYPSKIAIQPDGKILIGGNFTSYNGTSRNRITRLIADGSLDANFNIGTGLNNRLESIAIQSNGKILIGGWFTSYNGITRNRIARLNTDGSLDANFNIGTGLSHSFTGALISVSAIAVQADGKIIIGGSFTSYNGTTRNNIARINADGSLDSTFNPGTGANSLVTNITIQANGKIIIGGGFTSYNGTSRTYIARLNADGSLDGAFNPGSGPNEWLNSVALQTDGKILINGGFTSYNGIARKNIARLNTDGSLDTRFNPGIGANGNIISMALQPDGKILIGGPFTGYDNLSNSGIARILGSGCVSTPTISGNETICPGDITVLTSSEPNGNLWSNGSTSQSITVSQAGIYSVRAISGICTSANSNNIVVTQINNPIPTISGNNYICVGDSETVLTSSSLTGNLWSNGATTRSITVSQAGSYSVQAISGTCTSASSNPIVVVSDPCGNVFLGNGNYNDSSKWSTNSLPAEGSAIKVRGNMFLNQSVSHSNITIFPNASVSIGSGLTLTATDTLNNRGIISGEGTLKLAGSNNQAFGGGIITNLLVNNNATAVQTLPTQISGCLTLGNNQVVNLNNRALTLLSTATHTAQLAQVPATSSIINAGNFTVQRWLNGNLTRRNAFSNGNYYFLGPVVQGQTMNLWNSVSRYNNQTFSGSGVGNLYLYNPTANNWYKPSSPDSALPVGAGVQVWFGAITFFGSRSTWSATGTPQIGDYNLPITAQRGFHLLSNPYPSTIDWDSPNWTKTGVANAIYIYDWVNRRYKSYIDGLGTNGGNQYLPTAQGFIVNAENNSPVLTAREGIKVSNQAALQRTESQVSSLVRMQVSRGAMTDEVVIAHRPNTQLAFEPQVDARKMMNPATNIFVGGAVSQSIASMDLNAATIIPIELLSDSTGMVTLSTTEFSGISGGPYYLVDEITTEVYPYTPQTSYQFYLNANERYSLSLRLNNVNGVNDFKASSFEIYPNPANDKVTIKTNGTGTLEILNTLGQVVITQPAIENNEVNVSKLPKGVYSVRFNGVSQKLVIR